MKLVLLATHNSNKRREIKSLLRGYKGIKIMNLDDLEGKTPVIVEDGRTFRQNAVKKAITVSKFFDGLVLADDSGIEVDALHGKPGVRSARFARKNATDVENYKKLLKLLGDTPEKKRSAKFVCHIAVARKGVLLDNFEGVIKGNITFGPKGRNGFGYDPIFIPQKHYKTFAEMSATYKNRISHRGIALKKLKKSIGKHLKKI